MPAIFSGDVRMDRTFRSGLSLLIGIGFLFAALVVHSILLETVIWTVVFSVIGLGFFIVGAISNNTSLTVTRKHLGGTTDSVYRI